MKNLSRAARAILQSPSDIGSNITASNLRFAAQLAQHAALLPDDRLDILPQAGVVLFEPDNVAFHRIDFDAIAIKCVGVDNAEIEQLMADSLPILVPGMFDGLIEWSLIDCHHRNQPTVSWAHLSRYDRIACVSTLMLSLNAWQMLWMRPHGLISRH